MSNPVAVARADGSRSRQPRGPVLRERILEAARVTFLAEGFEVSMDAVAAAAGTTKATVYKHFGSKQALFIAVIGSELDRALDEPARLVVSHLALASDLRESLVAACRDRKSVV